MSSYKLLSNKNIIKLINSNKYNSVYLWGYSNTTLKYLNKIFKSVDFIIDKDYKSLFCKYENINIIPKELIKDEKKSCIIIWGNYCKEIIESINFLQNINIFVDIENGGQILFNKKIIIETPSFSTLKNDTQHIFCKKLINTCIENHIAFETKPKINLDIFTKREIKNNEILISYHSIGENNKNIYRYKEGYLKGYVTFDKKGYSAWNSIYEINLDKELEKIDLQKAKIFFHSLKYKYEKNSLTKYKQIKEDSFLPSEDFIFFPMQVIDDSVVMHLSYFEPLNLLKELALILYNKGIKLVVKRHPMCRNEKVNKLLQKLEKENKIYIYKGDISNAIKKSKAVYTINSGVGFESLLYLKPVVTFGKSDYQYVTLNTNDLDNLDFDLNKEKVIKFVYFYLKNKNIKVKNSLDIRYLLFKILRENI